MLSRLNPLVAREQHELVRAVVVRRRDGGFVGHQDTRVLTGGVYELGTRNVLAMVMKLGGCEAVCRDALCGEPQRGAVECMICATRGMEVGRIPDAQAAVLVAANGVRGRLRSDVEILDLGAEGFARGPREGRGVGTAGGIEGKVYAPAV